MQKDKHRQSLTQWQTYLESLDPSKIELGLDRVKTVFTALNPLISSQVVVVAGTNGKGSTVAALQALLLSEGKTVGSYVSPHLQQFNERICYQGLPVSDDELTEAFEAVEAAQRATALTYFEFTTLAAILLLSRKQPDYLIFEVGLGGRLDAVNVLDSDIAIVTGVAMDHMDWLGNDLESIGFEKAGVYRANKPAIYTSDACPNSVLNQISKLSAEPYVFGEQLIVESSDRGTEFSIQAKGMTHSITMHDTYLPQASVLAALSAFALLGFELSESKADVLAKVTLKGRYQRLTFGDTHCVLDVAHNAQAAAYLAKRVSEDPQMDNPVALVGTMSDKELSEIFAPMVDVVSQWFLLTPNIPRASSLTQQYQALVDLGVSPSDIREIGAITPEKIKGCLTEIEAAVIFGSFYTVGEFLDIVDGEGQIE